MRQHETGFEKFVAHWWGDYACVRTSRVFARAIRDSPGGPMAGLAATRTRRKPLEMLLEP